MISKVKVPQLDRLQSIEARSRFNYLKPTIRHVEYDESTSEVVVWSDSVLDIAEIRRAVTEIVLAVTGHRLFESRVIRQTGNRRSSETDRLAEYPTMTHAEERHAHNVIQEYISLIGAVFSPKERWYPTLIPLEYMERCGYSSKFPQNLMTVHQIPHDFSKLANASRGATLELEPSEFMLTPAVCFHSYGEISGQLAETQGIVLDATGSCFRHEAMALLSPTRLIEFTMREFVLAGTAAFVEASRSLAIERTWQMFIGLDLEGRIETANDPFFSPADVPRGSYQRLAATKYELIATTSTGEDIAIASFNNVGDSLMSVYSPFVSGFDQTPSSGCIAFGIQRWTRVLSAIHGADPRQWPTLPTVDTSTHPTQAQYEAVVTKQGRGRRV